MESSEATHQSKIPWPIKSNSYAMDWKHNINFFNQSNFKFWTKVSRHFPLVPIMKLVSYPPFRNLYFTIFIKLIKNIYTWQWMTMDEYSILDSICLTTKMVQFWYRFSINNESIYQKSNIAVRCIVHHLPWWHIGEQTLF